MSKKIIHILLISLVILFFFKDFFWSKYIINVLIVIIGFPYGKTDQFFYRQLPLLLTPIVLGIAGIFKFPLVDVFRDIYYFFIPIIFITIGCVVAKKFSLKEIINMFLFLGIAFSSLHIIITIQKFGLDISNNFLSIRDEVSPGNSLTILSLFILLFQKKYKLHIPFGKSVKYTVILLHIIALVLFGSRTYLMIALIFFGLLFFNRINAKKIIIVTSTLLLLVTSIVSFDSIEERRDGEDVTFTNKLLSSFTEIGLDEYENERDIVTKYRGYEAFMALKTYNTGSILEQIFGKSFGAMIDLEVYVQLGEGNFRFIPILHNGFLYLLIKTGIIGIGLYFLFFFITFRKINDTLIKFSNNTKLLFLSRLMKASIISLLVTNFVVSSLVNVEFEFLQIFLFSLFFKMMQFRKKLELL